MENWRFRSALGKFRRAAGAKRTYSNSSLGRPTDSAARLNARTEAGAGPNREQTLFATCQLRPDLVWAPGASSWPSQMQNGDEHRLAEHLAASRAMRRDWRLRQNENQRCK